MTTIIGSGQWGYASSSANLQDAARKKHSTPANASQSSSIAPNADPARRTDDPPPNRHSLVQVFLSALCGVSVAIVIVVGIQQILQSTFWRFNKPVPDPQLKLYIDNTITSAIAKALRDPVGLRDFALRADGACVLPDITTPSRHHGPTEASAGAGPGAALNDDIRVGNCWLIDGDKAQLGFKLTEPMHPTHVSVDHIPMEIAADPGAAPRRMILWGAVDGDINQIRYRSININLTSSIDHNAPPIPWNHFYAPLASFQYDIRAPSHVQTFRIDSRIVDSDIDFGVMVLEIIDNWGGETTCLYRLRLHGHPADH
ncbi:Spindle pole body-associated protein sad1 [Trametes pubescens]|uniref:Spindle pole body-associated protein sad1 n=1 Tax=Trametes pubescens TaxID=154538 RepID=A0A1M2W4S0_TRAPU|nr:Spindle pole body-associated protein sad1 [Trametes pubescens]